MATKTEERTAADKLTAARNKNLDLAIQQIAKDYGEGAIMRLGEESDRRHRCHSDWKHSDRSRARRRWISARSSGRSLRPGIVRAKQRLRLQLSLRRKSAAASQRLSTSSMRWILAYAKRLGVNLDDLLVSQPSSGEEALRICETLVRSNALDVIVLDSVAALVTKSGAGRGNRRYDRRRPGALDERGAA